MTEKHYELFREQAKRENRSIASLIRDAMAAQAALMTSRESDIGSRESDIGSRESDSEQVVVRQLLPGPGKYQIYAEVKEAE